MTDAPKRIWASPEHPDENGYGGFWIKHKVLPAHEYHRADLSADLVRAALERAANAVPDGIDSMSAVTAMALDSSENAIRDLADDPEAVAAIVAQVMEKE
jgi:hypothetical protein